MKSLRHWFIYMVLLLALIACGKKNESGKTNTVPLPAMGNPYNVGQTPYSMQGVNLDQVMMQNPCVNGFNGMPGMQGQQYGSQRIPLQHPLNNFKSQVAQGDIYVGVTVYGDVAAVIGQGANQPPLFVAYLCPRSFAPGTQPQLVGLEIGANMPRCIFKPITRATVAFPGTNATADFRWMDSGVSSLGRPFSMPVCR